MGLQWTVMTWNIHGTHPTDLERVHDVIAAETPDVVVLQEVQRCQAAILGSTLSMQQTWVEKHDPWRPFFPSRAEGAAILTPHSLEEPDDAVISDATSKRSYKRRIVVWAIVSRADKSAYRVFNAHLSPHDMVEQRRTEATRITAIAEHFGDAPPTIVAGDLNDTSDPIIVATLPGIEAVPPPLSNPSDAPNQAIDHVLVPAEATDVSVSAPEGGPEWAELSDHLPVTLRFSRDWVQGESAG
jgi:endonuclease/exonuclease/phosphatase family metal-dependent hydrolase